MTTQTAKIENGRIVLSPNLRKSWKEAKVFILPNKDTLVIKKFEKPISQLSELADRVSSKKISQEEIKKEIQSFRRNK